MVTLHKGFYGLLVVSAFPLSFVIRKKNNGEHKTISEKDSISLYCHFLVEDNLIWTIMKIIIFFHLLILLSWKLHHKGAL